jgi:HemY protein
MWRILVFIAVASALAMGAVWLAERPGEVSIVWGGLTIETTVAIAAIGVVVLVVLGMMLWTLVSFMFGLPTAFSFASRARKRARGFEAVSRGMVAIGAGDPAAARRHAADARKLIGSEALSLLLSAQSAQLSGDKPAAEAAFKQMLDEPATRVLGLRGLFVEARRRGDQMAARAFADEAVRLSPSLAWANDALLEHHSNAGEWDKARIAVERRAALRLADKTESRRHRAVLLAAEAQAKEDHDAAGALSAALDAVKLAPELVPAAAMAGRLLGARGDLRKAARIVEAAWREQPHPDLAQIYLHLRHGDSALDRLMRAEALMKLKPLDPESAFAVAQAAIQARDFARARSALSPLVAAIPTVRTCLLMAQIEDAEHGSSGRGREWLTRSVRAPRDNCWVADGVVSERWLPVSPISGRLDAFVWTLPPAILGGAGSVLEDWIEPAPDALAPAALDAPSGTAAEPPAIAIAPAANSSPMTSSAMTAEAEAVPPPRAAPSMARVEALPEAANVPPHATRNGAQPQAIRSVSMAEPIAAKGAVRIDHSSAPVSEPAGAAAAAGAPPKGPDFSRPPDDPGADRDAPTLRKRSFWGFFSR